MSVQISSKIRDKLAHAALVRLRRQLATFGQAVSIENVLFVAKDGDDPTAEPNSLLNKYDTVQGAMTVAASLPGSLVWVGPGVYDESVTVPDGALNIALMGESEVLTIIRAPSEQSALVVSPTQRIGGLQIAGLGFIADITGPGSVVSVDGSGVAGGGMFSAGGMYMRDVFITNSGASPALSITAAGDLSFHNIKLDSDVTGPGTYTTQLLECSGQIRASDLNRSRIRWDTAEVLPSTLDNAVSLHDCEGSLKIESHARVLLFGGYYQGSQADGYNALDLDGTNDATYTGRVVAEGTRFGWDVHLGANYDGSVPAPPTQAQSVLHNCTLDHDVTTSSTGATRHGPNLKSSVLGRGVAAGNGCDVDIRGSQFEQGGLAFVGSGTIDRSTVWMQGCTIPQGPGPGGIGYALVTPTIAAGSGAPLPAYAAGLYNVLVEPNLTDAAVCWNIDPAGKTGTTIGAQGWVNPPPPGGGVVPSPVQCDIVLVRR
jgi:hypothetical protein